MYRLPQTAGGLLHGPEPLRVEGAQELAGVAEFGGDDGRLSGARPKSRAARTVGLERSAGLGDQPAGAAATTATSCRRAAASASTAPAARGVWCVGLRPLHRGSATAAAACRRVAATGWGPPSGGAASIPWRAASRWRLLYALHRLHAEFGRDWIMGQNDARQPHALGDEQRLEGGAAASAAADRAAASSPCAAGATGAAAAAAGAAAGLAGARHPAAPATAAHGRRAPAPAAAAHWCCDGIRRPALCRWWADAGGSSRRACCAASTCGRAAASCGRS